MKKAHAGLLILAIVLMPLELRAGPPSVVLSDGGIEFPDGTLQETSAPAVPPATLIVDVDCGSGDSINDALATPARKLTIKITGICSENVVIRRDDVTLAGTAPATDGIHGVSTGAGVEPPVVSIENAANVELADLTIANGPHDGVGIQNGRVEFSNCVLDSNTGIGIVATDGSSVDASHVTVRSNMDGAVRAAYGTRMTMMGSTLTGNGGPTRYSVVVHWSSSLSLWDSSISGALGVSVATSAQVSLIDTPITSPDRALRVDFAGVVSVYGDDSTVQIDGAIEAGRKSLIWTSNINQISTGTSTNRVLKDSSVTFRNAVIQGLELETFSNGTIEGSNVGAVTCASGSNLFCELGTVVSSSTCGLCPVPAP